jgi:hypothetical protein
MTRHEKNVPSLWKEYVQKVLLLCQGKGDEELSDWNNTGSRLAFILSGENPSRNNEGAGLIQQTSGRDLGAAISSGRRDSLCPDNGGSEERKGWENAPDTTGDEKWTAKKNMLERRLHHSLHSPPRKLLG